MTLFKSHTKQEVIETRLEERRAKQSATNIVIESQF